MKILVSKNVANCFALLTFLLIFNPVFSQSPTWQWVSRASVSYSDEVMLHNCTDQSGNIFVVGKSSSGLDLGKGNMNAGPFLAKYNEQGKIAWSCTLPGTVTAMGADSAGNVSIAGTFTASFSLNGNMWMSSGENDIYVIKFNGSGTPAWVRTFGGSGTDHLSAFAVDISGECIFTGESNSVISFDQFVTSQSPSLYAVKLNHLGQTSWMKENPGFFVSCLAIDRRHHIYLGGAVNITPCQMFCSRSALMMLDAAGNTIRDSVFAKGEMNIGNLTIDKDLNIITVQTWGVNTSHTTKILKLDSTWTQKWEKIIRSNYVGHWLGQGLCTDSQNNIYTAGVCGHWYGKDSSVFDSVWLKSSGDYDVELVLMKLEPVKGSLSWIITAGGKGNDGSDYPTSMNGDLAIDPIGNLYLASSFHHDGNGDYKPINNDTCYFGSKYLTSAGEFSQVFLAKYGTDKPVTGIEKQTGGFSLVYPVPSRGVIHFKIQGNNDTHVRIYKSDGALVSEFSSVLNTFERDLRYLGPGIYWLEMQSGSRIDRKVILLQE